MLSAFVIALREGLEAALIVGIVISYLRKTRHADRVGYAWTGVAIAVVLSAILAIGMRALGAGLEKPFEQIFEGTLMLSAVAILTWMIFWMRYQARFLKSNLEHQVDSAVNASAGWGIGVLTFIAVFREGLETALFLTANAFAADASATLVGALLGLIVAAAAGVLIYAYAVRLDLELFFNVTSLFLIIFAAGLLAHGIHEFQEIGWLPILTDQAWSTRWLLANDSFLGSILRSLVGYNAEPSLLEVVGYAGYWLIVLQAIRLWTQRIGTRWAEGQA